MEAAALEAYRKDVQNNADLTSVAINKKLEENNLVSDDAKKVWREAKSNEGHIYFWNILTNGNVTVTTFILATILYIYIYVYIGKSLQ